MMRDGEIDYSSMHIYVTSIYKTQVIALREQVLRQGFPLHNRTPYKRGSRNASSLTWRYLQHSIIYTWLEKIYIAKSDSNWGSHGKLTFFQPFNISAIKSKSIRILSYRWSRCYVGLHQFAGPRRDVHVLPHLNCEEGMGASLVEEVYHTAADCK